MTKELIEQINALVAIQESGAALPPIPGAAVELLKRAAYVIECDASDDAIPVYVMREPNTVHFMDTRTRVDPADVVAIATDQSSRAIGDVLDERRRQLQEEDWSADHDDQHRSGELAVAAACYALNASDDADGPEVRFQGAELWPWADEWWKPKDPRRDLVRAGALIIAEIERLDRAGGGNDGR